MFQNPFDALLFKRLVIACKKGVFAQLLRARARRVVRYQNIAAAIAGKVWCLRFSTAIISSLTSLIILAGLPARRERGGIFCPCLTKASAPTMHSSPSSTSSIITAFMPTRQLRPMLAPCIMAPWPMCAPSFNSTVTPGNMCTVQFSCTLQPSSIIMAPQSPRSAQPGPMYTSLPMVTFR